MASEARIIGHVPVQMGMWFSGRIARQMLVLVMLVVQTESEARRRQQREVVIKERLEKLGRNMSPKVLGHPQRWPNLLEGLVAGAGFEPATFGL